MKILEPAIIDETTLVYSNVPETTTPYSGSQIYYGGQQVLGTSPRHVYESLVGIAPVAATISIATPAVVTHTAHGLENGATVAFLTTGALPEGLAENTIYYVVNKTTDTYELAATSGGSPIATSGDQLGTHTVVAWPNLGNGLDDASKWLDLGPSPRWAMFDDKGGTITRRADEIVVSVKPDGRNTALALFNLVGYSVQVIVTDAIDGEIYNRTVSLVSVSNITTYFDYCFEPVVRQTSLLLWDLPLYSSAEIQVIITNTGGMAECGGAFFGPLRTMGGTQFGSGFGIIDYTERKDNGFGGLMLVERGFRDDVNLDVVVPRHLVDELRRILKNLRGRIAVYIGSDQYGSLMVPGFPRDWYVTIEYPTESQLRIELESLENG